MQIVDEATIAKNCDRILERVSPSQVEAFELCPRRWYNDSARGLREPLQPGSAAERGVHIAEEVEHFGKTGKVREDARFKAMVEAVLPHLSPFSPTVSVEQWVESDLGPGLPKLRGRYDWFDSSQRQWEAGHPRAPLLPDVKSRSDFRYIKTPAQLAEDLQLNSYAVPLVREGKFEFITLRHAYTRTRGKPKGLAVSVTLSAAELLPRFHKTIASVREMTRWARERPSTADPLPPNTDACGKFPPYGCPHRGLCGFTTTFTSMNRSQNMNEQNGTPPQSDLMKRLAERTAALLAKKGAAPAGSADAAPPAGLSGPPDPTPAQAVPAREPIFCSKCGTELGPDSVSRLKDGTIVHIGCPKAQAAAPSTGPAVVPSDAPPRTNQPGEQEAATEKPKRAPRKAKAPEAQAELPAAPTPEQAEEAQMAEERRRAQPGNIVIEGRKLTVGEIEDLNLQDARERGTAPLPGPVHVAGRLEDIKSIRIGTVTQAVIRPDLVVYVNCVPTKGAHRDLATHFEEWLAPICEELCAEKGVVDYRLIQYTAKGDLAAKVRKYISTCPPVVLVSKFSPSADVFLESVIPHATQIIQGV